ncbi:MAG: phytanoyl-CoA dioxygenase family protein, partial [Deltaproteobacteria bacterium]
MISKQRTTESITCSKAENLVQEFASRGVAVLCPDSLGVPSEIHQRIYEKEKKAVQDQLRITPEVIPEIFDILDAPGLVAACDQLVGKNWAIVPFIHNAPFISGARDQHWHKDDNAPYNARKQRHHQAIQIEMLYYPQDVSPEMGPTAIVPFSHYWTFNHEENHDNFAGADHIDFGYLIEGLESIPVSGPDSKYTLEDIIQRKTKHDRRMVDAVSGLNWPLTRVFEVAPLRAGSILLYSHNTFHRGNHRRDDWRQWTDNPRFMWRFWIYRTNEPSGTDSAEVDWCQESVDPLTGFDLTEVSSGIKSTWRYHKHWLETGKPPSPKIDNTNQSNEYLKKEALQLFEQMLEKGDEKEPIRIGAAYELAAIRDQGLAKELLRKALLNERESVRRAGTYGLVALGPATEDVFLEAIKSPIKWMQKAGVYGLGEVSILNKEIFEAVKKCLLEDPSKYVRSVAAGSLGCLGRRTIASGQGLEW